MRLLTLGWMCLSAYAFQFFADWRVGALFAVLGGLAAGLSFTRQPLTLPDWGWSAVAGRLRLPWPRLLIALVCLLVLALHGGHGLPFFLSIHVQFALLVVAVGVLVWRWPRLRITRLTLIVAGLTLLALVLRLWRLETAVHFFVDELNFAQAVWQMRRETGVPLVQPFSEIAAFTRVYPYAQLWGEALFGPSLSALRVVSAVIGALTVPALVGLARELFDDVRLALVAGMLLATFPPHIHFSRLGINNIADPFFGVLALWVLVRGLKTLRGADFLLAGALLGLTQYFYEGGRILFPLLVLFWLELLALLHLARLDAPVARRAALLAGTAGMVALPVYYTLLMQGEALFRRFEITGVSGSFYRFMRTQGATQPLSYHLTHPFLVYVQMPDGSLFYGGNQPLVLAVFVPLLLVGLAVALWRWRQPGMLLLVLWLVGTSVGSALLAENSYSARFVVVFPALVLLMAIGLRYGVGRRWMLAAALIVTVMQAGYYFGAHLDVYNRQLRPGLDAQDAVFRMADLPAGTDACIVTEARLDELFLQQMRDYLELPVKLCFLTYEQLALVEPPIALFSAPDGRLSGLGVVGPVYGSAIPPAQQFGLYFALDGGTIAADS